MQFLPQRRQPGLHPGHLGLSGPQTGHQGVNFPGQLLPVPGIRELEVDHVLALRLQNLSQGLSVRTIALAGDDDRADLGMILQGGVNALDPGADGAGEAGGFGLGHPGRAPASTMNRLLRSTGVRPAASTTSTGMVVVKPTRAPGGGGLMEGHGLVMDRRPRPEHEALAPSPVLHIFVVLLIS